MTSGVSSTLCSSVESSVELFTSESRLSFGNRLTKTGPGLPKTCQIETLLRKYRLTTGSRVTVTLSKHGDLRAAFRKEKYRTFIYRRFISSSLVANRQCFTCILHLIIKNMKIFVLSTTRAPERKQANGFLLFIEPTLFCLPSKNDKNHPSITTKTFLKHVELSERTVLISSFQLTLYCF